MITGKKVVGLSRRGSCMNIEGNLNPNLKVIRKETRISLGKP
jgi:hypothetical protein